MEVRGALAAMPEARGVTVTSNPPLRYSFIAGWPYLDGEDEPILTGGEFTAELGAPPDFFGVAGIPILRGRTFARDEAGVVIVNESFARRYGGDVVGRTLRLPIDTLSRTIVGVVADVRAGGLANVGGVQLYRPHPEVPLSPWVRFLVRTSVPPEAFLAEARSRLAAIDPDVPIREATTGPDLVREQTARFRFVAVLLAGFAALGLAFALGGVYAAVSLDVHRRLEELAVRSALGASSARVAAVVLRAGLWPVAVGVAAGSAGALWLAPLLDQVLYGVSSRDPASALLGAGLILAAATLASLLPARRAARVDLARTLRCD